MFAIEYSCTDFIFENVVFLGCFSLRMIAIMNVSREILYTAIFLHNHL